MSWKYFNRTKIADTEPFTLIERPVVSEKATLISQYAQYVFIVSPRATKHTVKQSIEKLYGVKVMGVNTLPRRGKVRRFRGKRGYQAGFRKAVVTLQSGQRIDIGETVS